MLVSHQQYTGLNLPATGSNSSASLPNLCHHTDFSGIFVIKSLLGKVENFSDTVPVSDMRTVSDAAVSGVTPLRLLR